MEIYFITTSYYAQIYFIITSYMKYGWLWWRIVDTDLEYTLNYALNKRDEKNMEIYFINTSYYAQIYKFTS